MRTLEIKEKEIVYTNIKKVNFFENEQVLAITDRVWGINETIIFKLSTNDRFDNEHLKINYNYYDSNGRIINGEFEFSLENFLNDDVDTKKYDGSQRSILRSISYSVLGFLNHKNPKFENFFITNYSVLDAKINESLTRAKNNYLKIFNVENNYKAPLQKFYSIIYEHTFRNKNVIRDIQKETFTIDNKTFKGEEKFLNYMFPKLKQFSFNDVVELKQKMFDNKRYDVLLELDVLLSIMKNDNHQIDLYESIILNELNK